MKTSMKGRECVETKKVWRWKMLLPTTALIYALFWAPQEWSAQTISRIEWWANQTEMTSPVKTDSKEKTKTLQELMGELDDKKEWKNRNLSKLIYTSLNECCTWFCRSI